MSLPMAGAGLECGHGICLQHGVRRECHSPGGKVAGDGRGGPIRYTGPVSSVADDLRSRTAARVLALPVASRIALALSLGDDDLARFASATGLAGAAALRRLRSQRQRGRTPSACASGPRP
jgi:hypothetical protein